MERDETIKRIDSMIRVLTHSGSIANKRDSNSEETLNLKNAIEGEDRPKLANLFEDLIVLLKDDPDNKRDIGRIYNKIMDGYGHVKPVSEILGSVKSFF